jgi:GNAT superfamily N-acetyltransferase
MTSDDSLLLRVGGVSDVEHLAQLRYQWRAGEGGERGLDEPSFERTLRSWMEDHRASHVPFLALRNGGAIGMAWLALVDRVPGPEHFTRRTAYVQSVFVISPERSNGIGTSLMEFVLVHARELVLDYVVVHPSERSFPLYRRLGFTDTDGVLELRL